MSFRIVFMGTPEFSVPSLTALVDAGHRVLAVVTQPDRPSGRHQVLAPPPVKRAAAALGIAVLQPEKVRTGELERALRDIGPDLLVTAAYGRILPAGVLSVPRIAPLNVHASLLPLYRGAAPIQRCLIDGAATTGVTIMRMDEGMDTGDILLQRSIPILPEDDAEQLSARLGRLGAEALLEALERIAAGTAVYRPQDDSRATVVRPMEREDGRIDWSATTRQVHDLVRGTYPWPGAFTTVDGQRLKIHRVRPVADPSVLDRGRGVPPGTVLGATPQGIAVSCADGAVEILELQSGSGRRMMAPECSHNYRAGLRLGT